MIDFIDVKKTYRSGVEALKGVSFTIDDGDFVFVIGKSGSGKSTLLKCITCEESPSEGSVRIDGFDIAHMSRALVPVLRRQIGMIYQDFRLIETKTVAENVAFAGEIVGVPPKSLANTVSICLSAVGLKDKANAYPQELSGGEQQRVAIARAMVNNPKLIVADEPTGNLDPDTSESIMAMLLEINKNGKTSGNKTTVIICTHDSNLVDRMKQRVIEIDGGLIVRDEKASGYTEDRKEEAPSVITSEDYGNLPGGDLAFGEDSVYSDSYDDQGYEQKTGGFVFGDSAQETYVPVEEPVQIPEEPAPAQEETEIPSEMLLEEEPAAEPEVTDITVPEEVIAQEEPVLKEELVQEEPAPEVSLPEEPVFADEPEMGENPAPEEVQAPESAFEFPSQTEPSVSDREARRAEKKAQKEARRAEKQAEKEARRKAKLDEKFKTRTADPLKASDIDMVPEDDD